MVCDWSYPCCQRINPCSPAFFFCSTFACFLLGRIFGAQQVGEGIEQLGDMIVELGAGNR